MAQWDTNLIIRSVIVPYTWERETITVSEITAILYDQYNGNPTISVPITDGGQRFDYQHSMIPVQCNRCGNLYQTSPMLLLSMKADRGYSCAQCGHLSNVELSNKLKIDRLKMGREELIRRGENPDDDAADIDEETKRQNEIEADEAQMAQAQQEALNELYDLPEAPQKAQEAAPPVVNEKPKESPTKPTVVQPIPVKAAPEQPVPPKPVEVKAPPPEVKKDEPPPPAVLPELPEPAPKPVEIEAEVVDEEAISEEAAPSGIEDFLSEEDVSNAEEESFFSEPENLDDYDFDDFEPSDDTGGENDDDDNGEEGISETDEIALSDIIDGIEPEKSSEEDDEEEVENSEDDDSFIELMWKKWTLESLTTRYEEIQDSIQKSLGYVPYGDITYADGVIKVPCKICKKTFEIEDIDILDKVFTFTQENCLEMGLKFKGALSISPCPHCKQSILANGYNQYYRKFVEERVASNKLNIVKPEAYWYGSPNASYLLEANGIKQYMSFLDLCSDKKYHGVDMSQHELFRPKGTATKSKATSVENDETVKSGGTFTLPKHAPKSQFHFNAVDSSGESYFERQQKQAESHMVFRPGEKLKKSAESIASLDGSENPFERKEKLDLQFKKTRMYEFVKALANECNVRFKVEINQKTFEIPVVDFEPYKDGKPGFRLICADFNKNSYFNVPFSKIAYTIPFQFNIRVDNRGKDNEHVTTFKYSVLYSDSVTFREKATFSALVKYINPTILSYGGKRIQLEDNLAIQYTLDNELLREFWEDYSPYPYGKPCNGELGILATWVSSKEIDAKDVLETLSSLENNQGNNKSLSRLENEYNQYVACSIRYIKQFNEKTQRVLYTITEYIEAEGVMIADGLFQCVRALCKEYYLNYPNLRDRTPHVILEIDPNTYTSPSIRGYVEKKSLIPMNDIFEMQFIDQSKAGAFYTSNRIKQYLKFCYVRREAFRDKYNENDMMRQDIRKFNPKSLIKTMPEEIKAAGLQMSIYDDTVRFNFINNMGYQLANQLEIKEYFFHQGLIQNIMLDGKTLLFSKALEQDSILSKGGIVDSSGNQVNTINDPLYNPIFREKLERIRSGYHITPEANDFFQSYMAQKQQSDMAAWNQRLRQQQQAAAADWQQPQQPQHAPTMTAGAFRAPNMPGMSNL
jgi:NAD-dependent SIR2 family protein deacetylase